MKTVLQHYWADLLIAAAVGIVIAWFFGPASLFLYALLIIVEISLSGDNAVVNVKLLKLMHPAWVWVFMTVGILVAAGFMRFVFPILIVSFSNSIGFLEAVTLSLNDNAAYAASINDNEVLIGVFSGIYLLMIGFGILTEEPEDEDEEKIFWCPLIERPLYWLSQNFQAFSFVLSLVIILVIGINTDSRHTVAVFVAGLLSLAINLTVGFLSDLATNTTKRLSQGGNIMLTGIIGFFVNLALFIALEFQDAAFSFDGVAGGLAITTNPWVLLAGLGVGALFVRSMTNHLRKSGSLAEYQFLGHGAGYAILLLAASLLTGSFVHIPGENYLVGGLSVALIIGATVHSHFINKREGTNESIIEELMGVDEPPASADVKPFPVENHAS